MLTENLCIKIIHAHQSANSFFAYLPFPSWFMERFSLAFNEHRRKTEGVIFLSYSSEGNRVVGSIYVEVTPTHRSYGKQIPIFGWLFADSADICHLLLQTAEEFVNASGGHSLRGPINEPHLFGGWGILHEASSKMPMMVDSMPFIPDIADWIQEAGYENDTTYVSLEIREMADFNCPLDMDRFRFISPTLAELQSHSELRSEVDRIISRNFSRFLPDTNPSKLADISQYLAQIPAPEDFYILLQEIHSEKIVGIIFEVPNFFEIWQKRTITISDVNTMVVDKEYQNQMVIYRIYVELQKKLAQRGIQREIGVSVWKKNYMALKSFLKSAEIIAEYSVYQKKLPGDN